MVDFVRPNYLGTKTEFCNMFERPIQNGQCIDSTEADIKLMRYRAHVLHSLLVGFVQRRSHTVLQTTLPQKEEYVLLVRMTPFQRTLYETFMNEVVRSQSVPNPLKAFAVCCKIWNHPDVLYYFLKKRARGDAVDIDLEEVASTTTAELPAKPKRGAPKKAGKKAAGKPAASVTPYNTSADQPASVVSSNSNSCSSVNTESTFLQDSSSSFGANFVQNKPGFSQNMAQNLSQQNANFSPQNAGFQQNFSNKQNPNFKSPNCQENPENFSQPNTNFSPNFCPKQPQNFKVENSQNADNFPPNQNPQNFQNNFQQPSCNFQQPQQQNYFNQNQNFPQQSEFFNCRQQQTQQPFAGQNFNTSWLKTEDAKPVLNNIITNPIPVKTEPGFGDTKPKINIISDIKIGSVTINKVTPEKKINILSDIKLDVKKDEVDEKPELKMPFREEAKVEQKESNDEDIKMVSDLMPLKSNPLVRESKEDSGIPYDWVSSFFNYGVCKSFFLLKITYRLMFSEKI